MKRKQGKAKRQKATGRGYKRQDAIDLFMEKHDAPQAKPERVKVTRAMERSLDKADMPQE